MSIFQGKPLNTIIEQLKTVSSINKFFFSQSINEYESSVKERLDETLNLLKLKEHLMG